MNKVTKHAAAQIAYDAATEVAGTEFPQRWEEISSADREPYIALVHRAWQSGENILEPVLEGDECDDDFGGRAKKKSKPKMPSLFDTVFAAVVKALR